MLFVDEHAQLARDGEIHQGDEVGGRGDAFVLDGIQIGDGRAQERAAQAVAHQIDFLFAGLAADSFERGECAFGEVVVKGFLRQPGIGIDPGNDEDRVALVGCPFDEGIRFAQVEDIELVDPGRDDQQGTLEHFFRRGVELQHLHEVILENDFAGCGADIAAHLEGSRVGHFDAQLAIAFFDVTQEIIKAIEQVLPLAFHRLAQNFRIGHGEVGGRERVDELAGKEIHFLLGVIRQAFDTADGVMHMARGDEVGLFHEIEQKMIFPFVVAETVVALVG